MKTSFNSLNLDKSVKKTVTFRILSNEELEVAKIKLKKESM